MRLKSLPFRYLSTGAGNACQLSSSSEQRVTVNKVITQSDVDAFSALTGDHNPVHSSSVNRPRVHGAFLNGLVSAVIGTRLPGEGTLVLSQILRFPSPCYVGDSIDIIVEISDSRKITVCTYKCVCGDRIVLEGEAKLRVPRSN